VALILHAPLVPTRIAAWLQAALGGAAHDYNDDAGALVPIDLDLLGKDPAADPARPPDPAPPAPPPTRVGEGPSDAGAPDAGPRKPRPEPDGGPPSPLRDPVSAAGAAGKIAARDPNVQLLIAGNVIRKHELGPAIGQLLVKIPEWNAFFEGSPIDPLRDLDHLLITAPRLRGDTGKLVAVMDLNLPASTAREAMDLILHRNNGVWIEDAPVTAARVRVGGAPRIVALVPERRTLAILPGDAEDQLTRLKQAKGFRNSREGLVISLLTPARPFKDVFPLPETLKWMRVAVTPAAGGSADVVIEMGDRSAAEAERHAPELTRAFDQRRKIDVLGLTTREIVGAATFVADGEVIRARLHVTSAQLRLILAFAEENLRQRLDAGGSASSAVRATEH
jgi:hypothetical protein